MTNALRTLMMLCLAVLVLSACSEDDPSNLEVPDSYNGADFETNASAELNLITKLGNLASAMKAADGGNAVTLNSLTTAFNDNSGGNAIPDNITGFYANIVPPSLEELANASGGTYDPLLTPEQNAPGGHYGSHLFNQYGLEPEQVVEKGLFAAMLYNTAVSVANGGFNAATTDRLLALFGANPSFPNSGSADTDPDLFPANYAARRDQNDGNGFYTIARDALIRAQAAIDQGSEFNDDRDGAIATFFDNWERSQAATIIYYLQFTITNLSATSPSDDDRANALHAYSEGVGFLYGFYQTSTARRTITDAQIESIATKIFAPIGGTPSLYVTVQDPVTNLPSLQEAIDDIQAIYGFTDQQVADFAINWVSQQGR